MDDKKAIQRLLASITEQAEIFEDEERWSDRDRESAAEEIIAAVVSLRRILKTHGLA